MKTCDNLVVTINGEKIEGIVPVKHKSCDKCRTHLNGSHNVGLILYASCSFGFFDSGVVEEHQMLLCSDCDSDGSYAEECIYYIENCELSKTPEGRLVKLAFSNNSGSSA